MERQYPEFSIEILPRARIQPDYGQAVEGAVTSIRPPYDVREEDQIGRHLVIMTKPNAVPTRAQGDHRNRIRDGLIAELRDKRQRRTEGREHVGITAGNQRVDDIGTAMLAVEDDFMATPAVSLVGIAIKLTLGVERFECKEPETWSDQFFAAAQKVAARLVGMLS